MAKGRAETTFRSKAPWIMALLMRDFPIGLDDSAAMVGNFGHECLGFTAMQEIDPTVKGSKGGYGWPMWTGPRRRAFEAWCRKKGLNPASDEANYRYLTVELTGSEKAAIKAVKAAKSLNAKVKAFELAYERAGVKHYDSRNRWAAIALDASQAVNGAPTIPAWALPAGRPADAPKPPPAPEPRPEPPTLPAPAPEAPVPEKPKKLRWSKRLWSWLTAGGAGGLLGAREVGLFRDLDWTFWAVLAGLIVALALIGIITMPEVRAKFSRRISDAL